MLIDHIFFEPGERIPNNPRFPALVYKNALPESDTSLAEAFEARFSENGWTGLWRNGVFSYHHYHFSAHEVLGIAGGKATLQIGGPGGREIDVSAGDCLLLPAGTGHRKIRSDADFLVIGGYPPGQEVTIETAPPNAREERIIRTLPRPEADPVMGRDGGLMALWNE